MWFFSFTLWWVFVSYITVTSLAFMMRQTGCLLRRSINAVINRHRMSSTSSVEPNNDSCIKVVTASSTSKSGRVMSLQEWTITATKHRDTMVNLLYPPAKTFTRRKHMVHRHPIYNFLHRYYRYSTQDLLAYSPGIETYLQLPTLDCPMVPSHLRGVDATTTNENEASSQQAPLGTVIPSPSLHPRFLSLMEGETTSVNGDRESYVYYDKEKLFSSIHNESPSSSSSTSKPAISRHTFKQLHQTREILRHTCKKAPFLGCFGMHEWAMLYSGRRRNTNQSHTITEEEKRQELERERHQEKLALRVSQETIDRVVESSGVRCTHFDAWRFFHPDAQPLNIVNPLTRKEQANYEQPGCIHANMDLFRFAYQLYPLISSELLIEATQIALKARSIDMRGSPYDVSMYPECQDILKVETLEGKNRYVAEQEALAADALPIRQKLLDVYDKVLG